MAGQDIQRAQFLQRIFNELMGKQPSDMSPEEKHKRVAAILDEKLGPMWRDEANPEGLEFVKIETAPVERDYKSFYDKVRNLAVDDLGIAGEGPDAPYHADEVKKKPKDLMMRILHGKKRQK